MSPTANTPALPLKKPFIVKGALRVTVGASPKGIMTLAPVKLRNPLPARFGGVGEGSLTKKYCVPSMIIVPDKSLKSHCPDCADRLKTEPAVQNTPDGVQGAKAGAKRLFPLAETSKFVPEKFIRKGTNPKDEGMRTEPLVISLEFAGTNESRRRTRTIAKFVIMVGPLFFGEVGAHSLTLPASLNNCSILPWTKQVARPRCRECYWKLLRRPKKRVCEDAEARVQSFA